MQESNIIIRHESVYIEIPPNGNPIELTNQADIVALT